MKHIINFYKTELEYYEQAIKEYNKFLKQKDFNESDVFIYASAYDIANKYIEDHYALKTSDTDNFDWELFKSFLNKDAYVHRSLRQHDNFIREFSAKLEAKRLNKNDN